MPKLSFQDIKLLRKKWPKVRSRPQDDYTPVMEAARKRNFHPQFSIVNPNLPIIESWKVPREAILRPKFVLTADLEFTPVYIRKADELMAMINHLYMEKTFAMDLEFEENHCYLKQVALIQIATRQKTFLVDPYPLYEYILIFLKPILENPIIVKLFFGGSQDILMLSMYFQIHPVGVIDVQSVYAYLHINESTKFNKVICHYFSNAIKNSLADESVIWAEFRCREHPSHNLPTQLERYAALDAHLLIRVWDHIRSELTTHYYDSYLYILQNVYDSNLKNVSKSFTDNDYTKYIRNNYRSYQEDMKRYRFNSEEDKNLFDQLHQWRHLQAKYFDEPPYEILDNKELALLVTHKPTTPEALISIFNLVPYWIRRSGIETWLSIIINSCYFEDFIITVPNENCKQLDLSIQFSSMDIVNHNSQASDDDDILVIQDVYEPLSFPKNPKHEKSFCNWCKQLGHHKRVCTNAKNEFSVDFRRICPSWKKQRDRRLKKWKYNANKKKQCAISLAYEMSRSVDFSQLNTSSI